MRNSLQTHIAFLENTIQSLRNRLTRPGLTIEEIEDIELQLSTSESALDHYRQAYALEAKISSPEPTNNPSGSDSVGEHNKTSERSSSGKRNQALATVTETSKRQLSRQCRDLSAGSRVKLQFGIPLNALKRYRRYRATTDRSVAPLSGRADDRMERQFRSGKYEEGLSGSLRSGPRPGGAQEPVFGRIFHPIERQ